MGAMPHVCLAGCSPSVGVGVLDDTVSLLRMRKL